MNLIDISYKKIWLMTYPILISLLMEYLIGLTDTAFLGRVGEVELGASAIAGVYYLAIFMPAFGFSIGAQILMARRNGEERETEIGPLFQQGVLFLTALALLMFFVSKYVSPWLLRPLIHSHQVYDAAISYLDWRIYGFFFSFNASMFRAFYVAITRTRTLTWNSIVMVLTNVVLNYVLVFGKFGFPALGIAGSAIASSIAELVSLLFFVFATAGKSKLKLYGLYRFVGFSFELLMQVFRVSIWTMIQAFVSMSTWFIFFVAVEQLGERPLAISNIVRSISSMLFMLVNSFASTVNSLVSNLMGAGQSDQVMRLNWKVVRLCYLILLPLMALIAVFPKAVLGIYTDNVDLIAASVPSLWVMVSVYFLFIPGIILFNTVSGTGNTRAALFLELGTLFFYALYTFYVVVWLKADVAVCWTTEHAYSIVLLLFLYFYLKKANWRAKKI